MKKTAGLFMITAFLFSCIKEGPGGKAVIMGTVKHHAKPIPGAVVYIKYNTKESPGTNTTYYDASVTADAQAHYEFVNLKKGDYFLFGVGYDSASTVVSTVSGGIPVHISKKNETVSADVPVTE